MKISEISVCGLFDRFDHNISFDTTEVIKIMIGPNGIGKTMILRIINALFALKVRDLAQMPYDSFIVVFNDGSTITVSKTERIQGSDDAGSRQTIQIGYQAASGKHETFIPRLDIRDSDLGIPLSSIDDIIPNLDQIGRRQWRDEITGGLLTLEDVISRYGDKLPGEFELDTPEWLSNITNAIPVRYIETERLIQPTQMAEPRIRNYRRTGYGLLTRTVRRHSEELKQKIQQTLTEYGTLAQSLDRTFPARLVGERTGSELTLDALMKQLVDVNEKRASLVEAGLLPQEQQDLPLPLPSDIDKTSIGVLAVYARDAQEKMSVFDDLSVRISTLKRITNSRFLYNRVNIDIDGLGVETSDGVPLELEMLSSGEQHQLVIIYDLLFSVSANSLLLIDEPELSMHVAWQEKLLDDLEQMAKISDFSLLIATHSPQIIGERWDLTVSLRAPNGP